MGKPCPGTPVNDCGTRTTIKPAGCRGWRQPGGGWLLGGHAGALTVLGHPEAPKRPISHPGARAGVIWLEPGRAGESYSVSYPDGHRGGGACGWQIGVGYRLGIDDI